MATTTWASDASHSEIGFKIKHLMITSVKGRFTQFEATATTESDDFVNAQISFSADIASISTGNADRDGHLQSPDFFDAAKFPKISFSSTEMRKISDGEYSLTGNLMMHGVTKAVSLNVEFGGIAVDPYGQTKAGFTIEGKLNRSDFELSWGSGVLTETGSIVLGDEIKIMCDVQLIKQSAA